MMPLIESVRSVTAAGIGAASRRLIQAANPLGESQGKSGRGHNEKDG